MKEHGFPDKDITTYLTLHGKNYSISRSQVLETASKLEPLPLKKHNKYFTIIGEKRFSLSQLVYETLHILPIVIGGQAAYRCLEDLGFKVYQKENPRVPEE